ncbi:MAG: metallophosphoesterase [Kangiellaceae bacterium]|jgi:predicted phosphodiesterase|nr:metallophosphoesterase [Kangiellaceae bacterium]
MPRTIVIGDVHGCADEFEELLKALELKSNDRILQVGDLVNRGPDSKRVIALARAFKIEAILGNHELRLLRAIGQEKPGMLKDYDYPTIEQLSRKDWDYLEKLPKYIYEPTLNTVIVHGGFLPNTPWEKQSKDTVTSIQVISAKGKAAKRSDEPDAPFWADTWCGEPFVVYGHTPRPNTYERPGSIGIDTGCVYGGHLTAYIIEDKSLVQVRAHKAYAHSKRLPDPV